MDVGRGWAVGAGRGDTGDDGGHNAPRPERPAAARSFPGSCHPSQAARLLPPLHGLPARPFLLDLR
jgi:hypothetical protein